MTEPCPEMYPILTTRGHGRHFRGVCDKDVGCREREVERIVWCCRMGEVVTEAMAPGIFCNKTQKQTNRFLKKAVFVMFSNCSREREEEQEGRVELLDAAAHETRSYIGQPCL